MGGNSHSHFRQNLPLSHPVKHGSPLTLWTPHTYLQKLVFFFHPCARTSSIPPSSRRISSCHLPASRKVASELRRGQSCRGIWKWEGREERGGPCLLAMRASRSVLLSVCEAAIRFQDFPSVTGLLTKPCTPPREDSNHDVTHSTPQQSPTPPHPRAP